MVVISFQGALRFGYEMLLRQFECAFGVCKALRWSADGQVSELSCPVKPGTG